MNISRTAHGKFGELLQGALPGENQHFQIILPIKLFSTATFQLSEKKIGSVVPGHKIKAKNLCQKILDYFQITSGFELTLKSDIPEGKGLGSSTADLVASAYAITQSIQKNLPEAVFLEFLREIEPSDGTMYDNVVCFYHRQVKLHSVLGNLPDLVVIGLDEGGVVDTVQFNKTLLPYSEEETQEYAFLLRQTIEAVKTRDIEVLGKIATRSAIMHQKRNAKKNLENICKLSENIKAPGVIVAHSGTYIGILLDKKNPACLEQQQYIEHHFRNKGFAFNQFEVLSCP